jgi:hypothetical protein
MREEDEEHAIKGFEFEVQTQYSKVCCQTRNRWCLSRMMEEVQNEVVMWSLKDITTGHVISSGFGSPMEMSEVGKGAMAEKE